MAIDQVAKKLERALEENGDRFLCPECRRFTRGYVYNLAAGYVCRTCDFAIELSS